MFGGDESNKSDSGDEFKKIVNDVVYVDPGSFEARHTPAIAAEVDALNRELVGAGRPYLLIGFGRWGSSDPWLGIPANWSQISGARAIVEATLPDAFVYRWRLWTPMELRDAMRAAGLASPAVYPSTPDAVDDEGRAYVLPVEDLDALENEDHVVLVAGHAA